MIKKPLLEVQNIHFERGGRTIFSSINFSLEEGNVIILTGRNGSGKTSLLKCLAGFYPITKGKILWDGEDILPAYFPQKKLVAWLGHFNAIKPSLSVKENLLFYANLWSIKKTIYEKAINLLSFNNYLEFPASWLSAGEKRKLCLVRLLFCPAKVWILDEPTTFLDDENKNLFINIMDDHVLNGGAIVCATHDNLELKSFISLSLDDF